ncbi:MAG: hypothetical protein QME42_07125 [bacterium]|nr:hypothetical protein [bacterium]
MSSKNFMIIFCLFCLAGASYAENSQETPEAKLKLSLVAGSRMINDKNYNELILQPEFNKGKFGIGLNLLARWNADEGFRDEDWDEIGNIINYIRFADKGNSPLYLRLGKLSQATLGHGFIVDRYSNRGTDIVKDALGSVLNIKLESTGLETLVNDVTDPRVCGARIYFKPLKNIDIPLINKIILGATYVQDSEPQSGNKDNLTVKGIDLELPIYKWLSFHTDYARISDYGHGVALGLSGNIGQGFSSLAFKTELRDLGADFIPGIFNSLYEITRPGTSTLQQAENQKSWDTAADWYLSDLAIISLGYEDRSKEIAPKLHLGLKLENELFLRMTRQNISISFAYDHERREKGHNLIDFNAPNSTLTGKINFRIAKNISLNYTHQEVYNNMGKETKTSLLSTKVLF